MCLEIIISHQVDDAGDWLSLSNEDVWVERIHLLILVPDPRLLGPT
jgi:hypothetical protein